MSVYAGRRSFGSGKEKQRLSRMDLTLSLVTQSPRVTDFSGIINKFHHRRQISVRLRGLDVS
jgi:hypothetical protein